MNIPRQSWRITAAISLAALSLTVPLSGQGSLVSPACQENCPLTDAVCQARQALCQTKLGLYFGYMTQLGAGVTMRRLPQTYVDVLQPFYTGANLNDWRFGFSDRQPANNATTDCTNTYFNNAGFVDRLANGLLDKSTNINEYNWLFHELQHVVQCRAVGGRDRYARMWFNQLEVGFIRNADLATLHDRMPMEGAASSMATNIENGTAQNLDRNDRLVRSISVAFERDGARLGERTSAKAGDRLRLTARATGGSTPLNLRWRLRLPAATSFTSAGTPDSTTFDLVPDQLGAYQVSVEVSQEGSELVPAQRRVIIDVEPKIIVTVPPTLPVTSVGTTVGERLSRALTAVVKNTRGVAVQASVCVGVTGDADRFGQVVAGLDGRAAFQIVRGTAIKITAAAPGYIGVSQSITMPDASHQVSFTLRPGIGGATCQ